MDAAPDTLKSQAPTLPAWVIALLGGSIPSHELIRLTSGDHECALTTRASRTACLVSGHLPHADKLDAKALRSATAELYRLIHRALNGTPAPHAVRMWNFIPGIHASMGPHVDRYQVFNQGRFDAFLEWFGEASAFGLLLPTASGVGHNGHELVIHALGVPQAGRSVDNPRQRPAFTYSRRYGPKPPCFVRGIITSLHGAPRLLIGGTASVLGEDSVHPGSLQRQLPELLRNLATMLDQTPLAGARPLDRLCETRVYYRFAEDRQELETALADCLPLTQRIEWVRADICRRELLVEIEAVAHLAPASNGAGLNRCNDVLA